MTEYIVNRYFRFGTSMHNTRHDPEKVSGKRLFEIRVAPVECEDYRIRTMILPSSHSPAGQQEHAMRTAV